ncbi:MAG: hypothetical protein ABL986_02130 [Vicinamibacterales bacterium]
MFSRQFRPRIVCAALLVLLPAALAAQQPPAAPEPPTAPTEATPEHVHDVHQHAESSDPNPMSREGSGTSWLPVASPMYAIHGQTGAWQWMTHGNLFVQYLEDAGLRGQAQFGSINWLMLMGQRSVGAGRIVVRGMLSAEPLTIRGCGYPDLLASGEICDGEAIVDRQHPHDAFMELAVSYDRPLLSSVRWQVYGGPAGEPALGPVAFPHRPSAMANPLAPIAHHWLDATHVSFGVVTGAVYGKRWKIESSAFNGREPDEDRGNIDLARLDSVSGRLTVSPGDHLALQVSAGRLNDAEAAHGFEPATDVTRVTASALVQGTAGSAGWWAGTLAWGRNSERGGATHAVLAEGNVTLDERNTWFGRVEVVGKEAHDLSLHGPRRVFGVAKLQAGYVRTLQPIGGLQPGLGVSVSSGIVGEPLRTVFGSRVNRGFGVFLSLRPARH